MFQQTTTGGTIPKVGASANFYTISLIMVLLFFSVGSTTQVNTVTGFVVVTTTSRNNINSRHHNDHCEIMTTTTLFERQARRNLPKRRRRNDDDDTSSTTATSTKTKTSTTTSSKVKDRSLSSSATSTSSTSKTTFQELIEYVPMISSMRKEAGVDYWIDPLELQKEKTNQRLFQRQLTKKGTRQVDPERIPDSKLWKEVLSPYKDNWIGLISITLIVFAFIFKNFPEIIDPPIISNIPDII